MLNKPSVFAVCALAFLFSFRALASEDQGEPDKSNLARSDDEIARELSNPAAPIANMPLRLNWDYGGGPDDNAQRYYMQVQPVIPVAVDKDWFVISRSSLLLESRDNFAYDDTSGIGDLTQTFWLTPKRHSRIQLVWGVGPAFLFPTSSDGHLGERKWAAGPSMVLAAELPDWTVGFQAHHLWSYAGGGDRSISRTFVEPFLARHLPDALTLTLSSEYAYDWVDDEETFPLDLMLAKVVRTGRVPVAFSAGGRYYVDSPLGDLNWGMRGMVTIVFPTE